MCFFFFFQAEDGIRDIGVTGVQTCALPISMGRSSAGRHDTRHLSTGIEAIAAPKPYEFGDTLNIDPSSTILNAVQRNWGRESFLENTKGSRPHFIDIDYEDLMVAQSEYQSS